MNEDANIFEHAVSLILNDRADEASLVLQTFPATDPVQPPVVDWIPGMGSPTKKEPLNTKIQVSIYRRDGWLCRYCRRKLIVPGVLELLTIACPRFKGLLAGHHMPADRTEAAVNRVYPNVDHIRPVSRGGAWRDPENHVTACTPCNTLKSNRFGWTPLPIYPDGWVGLTSVYRPLAEKSGVMRPYHLAWMKSLDI